MTAIQFDREIRFLESVDNLKRVIKTATGRMISTELALQVSVCLQQGRLFFESASTAAAEIRPLLLSYGSIAFAKATVMARTFTKLESLPHSHGLTDVSAHNSMTKDLRVKIEDGDGTFQRLVDTANGIERLSIIDGTRTVWIATPGCRAAALANLELPLEDILGRVGELGNLYRETFEGEPSFLSMSVTQSMGYRDIFDLRIDVPAPNGFNANELLEKLGDLKQRFPFLSKLTFTCAQFAWDHNSIVFDNRQPGGGFPVSANDIEVVEGTGQLVPAQQIASGDIKGIPLGDILPCSQGGLFGYFPTFCAPVRENVYLSEIALLYLGTYLLGSLVRYRPQTWVHALYGNEMPNRPRDDATRALIQSFLDIASSKVPQWCVAAIRAPILS
jgi:YaaC-like Protein